MSHHFHVVLQALATFAKVMIKPSSFNETLPEILKNMKYYLWSRIVLMEGTHIPTVNPIEKVVPYRSGWKNECAYDMRFTWTLHGWEGSVHDYRIFMKAITR